MKLTDKQKEVISKMREGQKMTYRRSPITHKKRCYLDGYERVSILTLTSLRERKLISRRGYTERTNNFTYALTELGKTINL